MLSRQAYGQRGRWAGDCCFGQSLLGLIYVQVVTLMSLADGGMRRFRGIDEAGREQRTKRGRGRGRCRYEWLAAVLLCNTMASEGYFSEGGSREDKSGADATGHVGGNYEPVSAYIGQAVV